MKTKAILNAIILILSISSCQHEETTEIITNGQNIVLSATIENEITTSRSNVTDEGYFTWNSGDAISVYTTNSDFQDLVISEDDGVGTSKANFVGNLTGENVTISTCAIYPAFSGSDGHSYNESTNTVTLQLKEFYELGNNTENTNALMLALISNDKNNLHFKHIGGVMRFVLQNVPTGASEFVFTALDKGITGSFSIDLDNETRQIYAKTFDEGEMVTNNSISIKFTELTESKDMRFFVPLPLGEYHGFTIRIKNASGVVLYEKSSTATNTIKLRTLTKMSAVAVPDVQEVESEEELTAALTKINDTESSIIINLLGDAAHVETINIPASLTNANNETGLDLIYGDNPTSTVNIGEAESSSTESEQGLGSLQISIPQAENDENEPSFNIDLPTMTVTLSATIESATFNEVTASTADNTLIVNTGVTIRNLTIAKGNVRLKRGASINHISTTETDETIYIIYEGSIPEGVEDTENLQHISAEYWESAPNGGIYSDNTVILLKSGSLKNVLGDNMLNITSLKVIGKINGDDICCLREMAGRNAYGNITAGKLEKLDLSEASIIEGGTYYYTSSSKSFYTSKDVIGEKMFKNTNITEIQLPNGITSINAEAFYACANLESVHMSDKVTVIKDMAFSSCSKLSSVNIPVNVEEINFQAFINCSSLTSIELPKAIRLLGNSSFSGCGLTSVTLPESIESVEDGVFSNCKNLKNVTLSEGLKYLGTSMFSGCTSLRNIDIPNGVHTIGNYAFYGCTTLTDINIPTSVTTILDGAFSECI